MLKPFLGALALIFLLLTAYGSSLFISGLHDAIDQAAVFSAGMRDTLHGVIYLVLGTFSFVAASAWMNDLDREEM